MPRASGGTSMRTIPIRNQPEDSVPVQRRRGATQTGLVQDLTYRKLEQSAFTYVNVANSCKGRRRIPPTATRRGGTATTSTSAPSGRRRQMPRRCGRCVHRSQPYRRGSVQKEMRWYLTPQVGPNNVSYDGEQQMPAGYWMLDFPLAPTSRPSTAPGSKLPIYRLTDLGQ